MNKKKGGAIAAVIDIGSGALKMRICQLKNGEIASIDRLDYPLRLGHEVFSSGKISFESLRELSQLLKAYSGVMAEYGVELYTVIATTALREAVNRAFVLDQLKIQNDMNVRVLEDDQEKTLLYSEALESLRALHKPGAGRALISYIGAGTIGLAVYDGKDMIFSQNIPMGALKLHDVLEDIRQQAGEFYTAVEEYLTAALGHVRLPNMLEPLDTLVLLGDETGQIAALCGADNEEGRAVLKAGQLRELYAQVRMMTPEKIGERFQITEDSAELLYSALAIYIRLLELTGAKRVIAPKISLWYPLMKQLLLPKSVDGYNDHVRGGALSCAKEMCRAYQADLAHAEAVRKYACKLFDKLKKVHGMGRRKRLMLELAALLHDCGYFVNSKQHLTSTYELIKNIDIYGMTRKEMAIVANVSRYNEYDLPGYEEIGRLDLDEDDRLAVAKLVAMFRLANALDKAHRQKFDEIKAKLDGEKLVVSASTRSNALLERWAFEQNGGFFEEVFGLKPVLLVRPLPLEEEKAKPAAGKKKK